MTKGIVHLKISCGLLAAVALIVGCTTEDGVVDVSACATDGVAELSAMCNDSGLSVSLKNTGKKPIEEAIASWQEQHQLWNAFCFGPGLIIDGKTQKFDYTEKVSCGYPTPAQRIIFCQTGKLEYLFLVTEGKEQDQPGLTVPECVGLLEARGGIQQAYNLDGGNSTQIILCGEKINAREYGKARDIADMIVFATAVKPE